MTYDFKYLLQIVGCFTQGKDIPAPNYPVDWNIIQKLAYEQSIPYIYLFSVKTNKYCLASAEFKAKARKTVREAVFSEYAKRERILGFFHEFQKADTGVRLIKGYAVAQAYYMPELRVSGDTDILIAAKDERRICQILEQNGFSIEKRKRGSHHSVCSHSDLGCIELHVNLYGRIARDSWFDSVTEEELRAESQQQVCIGEVSIPTLSETNHLVYLCLHFIKHLILCEVNFRMLLDIALFYRKHKTVIMAEQVWDILKKLGYDKCIELVLGAMIEYAGFEKDDFPGLKKYSKEAVDCLLQEMESGMLSSAISARERHLAKTVYTCEITAKKKGKMNFAWISNKVQCSPLLHVFYPEVEWLKQRYPNAAKVKCGVHLTRSSYIVSCVLGMLFNRHIRSKMRIKMNEYEKVIQKRRELYTILGML